MSAARRNTGRTHGGIYEGSLIQGIPIGCADSGEWTIHVRHRLP